VTLSVALLPIEAAKTMSMGRSGCIVLWLSMIHGQQLLTLHWRSCLGCSISSLAFLPIQAADALIINWRPCAALCVSIMQDQKLLPLCSRSFLGGASDIIASIFTHERGQHFDYTSISSHSCLIIQDARTNIVDALVTLSVRRYWRCWPPHCWL